MNEPQKRKTTRPADTKLPSAHIKEMEEKPSPLTASVKIRAAVDDIQQWINTNKGRNVQLVVYHDWVRLLNRILKAIERRREAIERL